MPEGDSLRRVEALLEPVLSGQVAHRLWFRKLRGYRPREGQRIERVHAVGKHLLIDFDRRLTLRTHLGMAGAWRVSAAGSEPPASARLRVVIGTDSGLALCFSAPTIDTFVRDGDSSPIDHLGPDLSDDDVDLNAIVARVRAHGGEALLAEALLDQRIAAGVGNVFKSEVAFMARLHPFVRVADLSDETLTKVWKIAHRQLVQNRSRRFRKTTPQGAPTNTYVYDRFRSRCLRCSDSIRYSRAGEITERSTYWCPRCQPEGGPNASGR